MYTCLQPRDRGSLTIGGEDPGEEDYPRGTATRTAPPRRRDSLPAVDFSAPGPAVTAGVREEVNPASVNRPYGERPALSETHRGGIV